MFDLNAIVSAAISAAITEATKPLLERIATLESANDILHRTQHEDMVAMRDRIAALEDQAIVTSNAVDTRISRLENSPAQGVDTSVVAGNYAPISKEQFKAMLQEWATKDALIDYLNEQEWFWDKMRNFIDAATEQAVDNHCETYDHDSYDSAVSDLEDVDLNNIVSYDSLEDAVRDAVRNLSFDISVS